MQSLTIRASAALVMVVICELPCMLGCPPDRAKEKPPDTRQTEPGGDKGQTGEASNGTAAEPEPSRLSESMQLNEDEHDLFEPGRSKREILDEIQWRGDLSTAGYSNGKSVSVIHFGLWGGPYRRNGRSLLAVFVDDRFEKFIRQWPVKQRNKFGDFSVLAKVLEAQPLEIAELERERANQPPIPPQEVNLGLAIAFEKARRLGEARRRRDVERNRELRDEFNPLRLDLGMTEPQVEAVFKSKPIRQGDVAAGAFRVYGSTELLQVPHGTEYRNVLTLFQDGKLTGIYGISGGPKYEEWLRGLIGDLPSEEDKR